MARLELRTDPPGGRISIAGADCGATPAIVEFDPSQSGQHIVVEAALADAYFGRQFVSIPPPGRPVHCTIPLTSNDDRVVFVPNKR
jgi:hypothetical protein